MWESINLKTQNFNNKRNKILVTTDKNWDSNVRI